ncbi:MAG: hypothetical protein C0601_04940 [Candidatus Muiribacterium halophilum]|uniref:DUF2225 domain-containing protein n=1 Tax=Muiribacterium halophilum TaxID=2053465 RepID=A0A2N5ZI45_MUIH1|nr:MAG: hypothetical protein C0601_04940 [Candidatus Muirbacterium halophilum]
MTQISPIFEKDTRCPICQTDFKAQAIRSSRIKVLEKWDDFGRRYSESVNPLFYSIWTCPKCLHSSGKDEDFTRAIIQEDKVKLLKHYKYLKRLAGKHVFSGERDAETGIKSLVLAAVCYRLKRRSRAMVASCYMRIAWIIRNLDRSFEEEKRWLERALREYTYAMKNEYSPEIGKLSEYGVFYIIANINHKLGNNELALDYIGKVIENKKKVEPFVLKKAELLYDDLKNYSKPVKEVKAAISEVEEDDMGWIYDMDLTLE